ncbi:MAG: hypothetical protein HZB67_00955, partial [Candidatus Aenigmarchaeota archaeon]|nr:hypothetical protein [Candidatus Aenigmarchaeota archaeon]
MGSTGGGFIIGFFLALLIFFSVLYTVLSPYSTVISGLYQTTQSSWFNDAITVLNYVKGITNLPGLNLVTGGASGVIDGIVNFMTQTRQTIALLYTLMIITLPVIAISIIMVIIGAIVVKRSKPTT